MRYEGLNYAGDELFGLLADLRTLQYCADYKANEEHEFNYR